VLAQTHVHYLHAEEAAHLTWEHRAPLLDQRLRQLLATFDVVALQEVAPGPMVNLIMTLCEGVAWVLPARPTAKGLAEWLLIKTSVHILAAGEREVRWTKPAPTAEDANACELANKPRFVPWAKVSLQNVNETLDVTSYHCPLELDCPRAMELHALALLDAVRGQDPFLLLADMNQLPASPEFARILDLGALEVLSRTDATCCNGSFRGCLDYVLGGVGVFEADGGGPVCEVAASMPNAVEGSDHVPVVVRVTFA
jgi:endonuclease/exonuclease/phosphatase family metal-dependent hydrolase